MNITLCIRCGWADKSKQPECPDCGRPTISNEIKENDLYRAAAQLIRRDFAARSELAMITGIGYQDPTQQPVANRPPNIQYDKGKQ